MVGVVTSVAEPVVFVRPTDEASDRPRRMSLDSVRAITPDAVRLKGDLPTGVTSRSAHSRRFDLRS
ncbi:hypothetical protein CV102_21995 [Natronococcus pandeyae]|uniref:Uncharacterized protein n=1 Tax=Natronococcus pandeyae TaxID=2055836 RepID=A0A8J8Q150_9EURY|nr:hypothetical protein CV102_21995 [Natronococcus pandeyae]